MRAQELKERKDRKGQITFYTNVSKFSIFNKIYKDTISRNSVNLNMNKI